MLKAYFPKFTLSAKKTDDRHGDGIGIICNGEVMLIDGFEGGEPTSRLMNWLIDSKETVIDKAVLTHAHYDHYNGLRIIAQDKRFKIKNFLCYNPDSLEFRVDGTANGRALKKDIASMRDIIALMKSKGATVIYIDKGSTVKCGDTTWEVWRKQPTEWEFLDGGEAYAFVNNGSLLLHSPETGLTIGGDGPENIKDAIKERGWEISGYDVSHHGNACSQSNAEAIARAGCVVAWQSCIERSGPGTTGWTAYGSRRVIQAGIPVLQQNEDIFIFAENGTITFKQGAREIRKAVKYEAGAWVKDGAKWKYKLNGQFVSGKPLKIDGEWHYFDSKGYAITGWYKPDKAYRYLDPDWKGAMVVRNWVTIGNNTYYLDDLGCRKENCAFQIGDKWYYFSKNGALKRGWFKADDGLYRFCDPYMIKSSWVSGIYYVDDWGRRIENKAYEIGGKWYYFDKAGKVRKGWLKLSDGNRYLTPAMAVNTTMDIGGKTYRFDGFGRASEVKKNEVVKPAINLNPRFTGLNTSARSSAIEYIVIHYTGSEGTARNNIDYFNNGDRQASADFFVGHQGEIWQYNTNLKGRYSWHCGGDIESPHHPLRGKCLNRNSIGIELCTHKSGEWIFNEATLNSAARLTEWLMQEYGIPIDRVVRHYDVTGKRCPGVSGWTSPDTEWLKWKARIRTATEPLATSTRTPQEAFLDKVGPLIRADAKNGVCGALTAAQAILESGWGTSTLATKANNLFGMKCMLSGNTWPGTAWDGKSAYSKQTGEYYNGSYKTITADFRSYPSWEKSIADHSAYLLGAKNGSKLRYAGLKGETDYRKAAQIVKNGGYATSPDYVDKLCRLIEQYGLTRYNS